MTKVATQSVHNSRLSSPPWLLLSTEKENKLTKSAFVQKMEQNTDKRELQQAAAMLRPPVGLKNADMNMHKKSPKGKDAKKLSARKR